MKSSFSTCFRWFRLPASLGCGRWYITLGLNCDADHTAVGARPPNPPWTFVLMTVPWAMLPLMSYDAWRWRAVRVDATKPLPGAWSCVAPAAVPGAGPRVAPGPRATGARRCVGRLAGWPLWIFRCPAPGPAPEPVRARASSRSMPAAPTRCASSTRAWRAAGSKWRRLSGEARPWPRPGPGQPVKGSPGKRRPARGRPARVRPARLRLASAGNVRRLSTSSWWRGR